ncbi:MAG: histidinol-phosphate transaminase [Candidatus Bathyarchaeia archaeon]
MKIRDCLTSFKPYEWEPSNEEIARRVGLRAQDIIRFDTNATPRTPLHLLRSLSGRLMTLNINDYPDTSYSSLRRALARYLNCDFDQVSVTAGADEALDLVAKVFVDPGSSVVVSVPTYSYYGAVVGALGGGVKEVQRKLDFSDDVEAIISAITPEVRIIFLCSPNNPTGNVIAEDSLIRLLESTDLPVVVDEAYAEFAGKSFTSMTSKYRNLIVLRTFSKAFALAGVRVGYMVACKEMIGIINKVRPPNSVGVISLALAEMALEQRDALKETVDRIIRGRDRLAEQLRKLGGLTVYPSEANFLLVRFADIPARAVYEELLRKGIVVRDLSQVPRLENCLRFTVRTEDDNNKLLNSLGEILSRRGLNRVS